MCIGQPFESLANDVQCHRNGYLDAATLTAGDHVVEIPSIDVLHRDEQLGIHNACLECLDDVGMIEHRQDIGFVAKQIEDLRIPGELLMQDFDGEGCFCVTGMNVAATKNASHTTGPHLLNQVVRSKELSRARSVLFAPTSEHLIRNINVEPVE